MEPFYLGASILLLSLIFSLRFLLKHQSKRPPPGPFGLPIAGYLPFLGDNLLHDFKKLESKHGPIFKLHLGHQLYTVISSPSLAREVLRDHDAIFAHRITPAAVSAATFGANDIAWSPPNSEWRAMRRIFVTEMMSGRSFDQSYHLRRVEVRKTVGRIHREAADGRPVDLGQMAYAAELDVLINLTWGATAAGELGEKLAAEVRAVVAKIMDLIGKPNVSDFYPFLSMFDFQGIRREMENLMESLNRILDVVIAEHNKNLLSGDESKEERRDFLQIMLELIREGDAEMAKISQQQFRGMIMDVVGGGSDTSATIEWVMAELMNNPKAMAKAQKEVDDVVGLDNIVEELHIPKLKYLEAVLKETLRLHPPVPLLIPRSPSQTSTIGGFYIPKGSGVFINIWSIQRDPSIWDNPMDFKPERFLDATINQYHYLPFGSGRRICAGRALAERMILHFVASLLHSFDWSLPDSGRLDMSETYGLVMRKSTPLIVIPTPRLPDSTFYM